MIYMYSAGVCYNAVELRACLYLYPHLAGILMHALELIGSL